MSTPLMKQYALIKAKYPDTVLLFRWADEPFTFAVADPANELAELIVKARAPG